MAEKLNRKYVLGPYWLEPERQLFGRDGEIVHLTKKPYQVLLYLIENRDRYISTDELLDHFWDGHEVYLDAARKSVGAIRKALDDRTDEPRFIETRWGLGYRYVGPLEERLVSAESAASWEQTSAVTIPSEHSAAAELAPAESHASAGPRVSEESLPGATTPWSLDEGGARSAPRRTALRTTALLIALVVMAFGVYRGRAPRAASAPPPRSVAVLPLKNLSNDPTNDYLCAGLTEGLINALTKIRGLRVIPRDSTFSLNGRAVDPRELRQSLGVATVLQGGVLKGGGRLRVEVRLVSTEDGRVLWAGAPYERQPDDIFALQDEIARSVVGGLAHELTAEDEQGLTRRGTNNHEAYEAYLRGRYEWYKRTKEGLNKSLAYYQEAIKRDPNYAPAYAGVADYYATGVWFLALPPQEATEKAKAAARHALELDDGLVSAHLALAGAYQMERAWADSRREVERALELDPNSAEAHHQYAYSLLFMRQADSAVAEIKRARELDPLSIVANVDVGEILLYARRYDEAVGALQHAIEMEPNRANEHWDLACALQQQGAEREAFEEFIRSGTLSGWPPETINEFRAAYAGAGLRGFWRKLLELSLEQARRSYVPPFHLAQLCAQAGDHDRAFAYLEEAYREHSPMVVGLKVDPLLDPLRDDPRFAQLDARVGL